MTVQQFQSRYWSFNDIPTLQRLSEDDPNPDIRMLATIKARYLSRREEWAANGEIS